MTVWQDYSLELRLDPKEAALLIIDVQADFCSPDCLTARRHGNVQMQALPAKINSFVDRFQALGGLPVYIRAVVDPETRPANLLLFEQVKGITRPTKANTPGSDFYGLSLAEDAIMVEKAYGDAFASTDLKTILDGRGIQHVLICGVRTEICVDATAKRAHAEGYNVFVLRDLVATRDNTQDHQEHALMVLDAYYAFVQTGDAVLALFDA